MRGHRCKYPFGPVVQEDMSFKEKFTAEGETTDAGYRPITITHLEPLAQVS